MSDIPTNRSIYLIIRCVKCNRKLGVYKGKTFFIEHARDSSRIVCLKCRKKSTKEEGER